MKEIQNIHVSEKQIADFIAEAEMMEEMVWEKNEKARVKYSSWY